MLLHSNSRIVPFEMPPKTLILLKRFVNGTEAIGSALLTNKNVLIKKKGNILRVYTCQSIINN